MINVFRFGRPGAKLSDDFLRAQHQVLSERIMAGEQAREELAALGQQARREGKGAMWEELERDRVPITHTRAPIPMTRVRALESFCATHQGLDFAPVPGQIADVPSAIVDDLVRHGRVEIVDPSTRTTRPIVTG